MKKYIFIFLAGLVLSCTNQEHFIKDQDYLNTVKSDFEKVRSESSNRQNELFDVFNQDLSLKEQEALMFLYAYMPLNDLADYDGEFFLSNVRLALKTKEAFNWGNEIPEDIFRHFVLPYRVNNENLDTSRAVFFKELSKRLEGMELKEAILEVNHWCHEKVNYKSTDERTISPLGAIKSTYGRCGEESTFTVTAMRAAGIPARQCYTPRWAHTDDNHAWVEVWVDGKWHYLGACEPEPDLDIAWFSGPALRAMLVNSNVFGKYEGPEEIILKEDKYTKVNMLSNYAPVKTVYAKVVDENNNLVNNATVEFQLYNYAEFYPIAKKQVDENGVASLLTGYGDLLLWAYNDNKFDYKKITVETTDTIILQLKSQDNKEYIEIFDIIPPIEKSPKAVSDEGSAQNKIRLAQEDSIRNAYASTFMNKDEAIELANKYNFEPLIIWSFIEKSRGNYSEIESFLAKSSQIKQEFSIPLLQSIAPKDLRDIEADVLLSHIKYSFNYSDNLPIENKELFINYVLNPRIANEKIIAYKKFLQESFGNDFILKTKNNISHLTDWVQENILISDDKNYYHVPITAQGVYELKMSDSYSRDLFFVAACRSFGIPSRLEPATKTPQYFKEKWIDINFEKIKKSFANKTGTLIIRNDPANKTDLKYRVHFAIAKFEDGRYNTLDYGWDTPFSKMDKSLSLEAGNYLLISGNRQSNGIILTRLEFFKIEEGEQKEISIKLRQTNEDLKPLTKISLPEKLKKVNGELTNYNHSEITIIGFLDLEKEPTKHTMVDIEKIASSFNNLDIKIYLFINENAEVPKYNMPKQTFYLVDENEQLNKRLKIGKQDYPLFMVVKEDKVYFLSKGYTIGIGEQMIKIIQMI